MEKEIKEFKDLKIGENFSYNKLKFTKLDENLSIINTHVFGISEGCWCPLTGCSCEYEKSEIRKYLNKQYLCLLNFNILDLNPIFENDLVTLLDRVDYLKYKNLIEEWYYIKWNTKTLEDRTIGNNTVKGIYSIYEDPKKSESNCYSSFSETLNIRAVFNFKPEVKVTSLGMIDKSPIVCDFCGRFVKNKDCLPVPESNYVKDKIVCDNCYIDSILENKNSDFKIKILKKTIDNLVKKYPPTIINRTKFYIDETLKEMGE